jgi:hypothetical protein
MNARLFFHIFILFSVIQNITGCVCILNICDVDKCDLCKDGIDYCSMKCNNDYMCVAQCLKSINLTICITCYKC